VYVGAHLPLDVVGGWAIGVFAASAVHLILGVPSRTQKGARVAAAPPARARSSIGQEG
jgi:membrane-associated phospholipid phosphatase